MIPLYLSENNDHQRDFPFYLEIHRLSRSVYPHGHDFIEFTYVFQGQGIEMINGKEYTLQPGTLTFLLPHQIHEIIVNAREELCLYVGTIGFQSFFYINDTAIDLGRTLLNSENFLVSYYDLPSGTSEQIMNLLNQMHNELHTHMVWNKLMFKTKLTELLIVLNRHCFSENKLYPSDPMRSKSEVWNLIHYVYQNYHEDITLESLSKRFYLSVPHISTSFKHLTGENFHSYLQKVRITHACRLLRASDISVTDIAFEAGFRSYATFSRVFLQHMKMSPLSYRKAQAFSLDHKN